MGICLAYTFITLVICSVGFYTDYQRFKRKQKITESIKKINEV